VPPWLSALFKCVWTRMLVWTHMAALAFSVVRIRHDRIVGFAFFVFSSTKNI